MRDEPKDGKGRTEGEPTMKTPSMDDSTEELKRAAVLAAARLSSVDDLRSDVAELTRAVNKLSRIVDEAYPTRSEVKILIADHHRVNARRRVATVFAATIVLVIATFISTFHTNSCTNPSPEPGATAAACDIIAPAYVHARGADWPTPANGLGWLLYGSLVTISLVGFARAIPSDPDGTTNGE